MTACSRDMRWARRVHATSASCNRDHATYQPTVRGAPNEGPTMQAISTPITSLSQS